MNAWVQTEDVQETMNETRTRSATAGAMSVAVAPRHRCVGHDSSPVRVRKKRNH